jgi:branched-subunit amino acid transport protein
MIDSNYFWLNIFFLTVGTLAIRASFILLSSRVKISDSHKELFTYIPAAVLPALVAPMVFFHEGSVNWLFAKERTFILLAAIGVSYLTRNMLATLGFGLAALYLVTHV